MKLTLIEIPENIIPINGYLVISVLNDIRCIRRVPFHFYHA